MNDFARYSFGRLSGGLSVMVSALLPKMQDNWREVGGGVGVEGLHSKSAGSSIPFDGLPRRGGTREQVYIGNVLLPPTDSRNRKVKYATTRHTPCDSRSSSKQTPFRSMSEISNQLTKPLALQKVLWPISAARGIRPSLNTAFVKKSDAPALILTCEISRPTNCLFADNPFM